VFVTAVAAGIVCLAVPGQAAADTTATYTATETIPVPPASNFAGSGGGDGWAVALTPTAVYNVFHHNPVLTVACHFQTDASACWDPKTITDSNGNNFATSGQPGLWLDQSTGKLYVFATRTSDNTGGVVCIDTTQPADNPDPFCGFTPLTAAGEASNDGISAISDGALVGSRWFAFNYFNGAASGAGAQHTENTLLCFDLTTFQPCSGQPFALPVGAGTVADPVEPPPAVATIGDQVIVPIMLTSGNTTTDELACFNGGTMSNCSGSWPVALDFSYDASYGAPFPLLSNTGAISGLCLPANDGNTTDPCFDLSGNSVATPAGMSAAITPTSGWNGPGLVLGPRVYVPDGNSDQVDCYDYSTGAACANFPKALDNLNLLYTINPDPQRPTCIWVNSDNGSQQIQDFDAYTGGGCGQGPIRVLASSLVVPTQLCTPTGYGSLQVTSPPRSAYSSGSISFEDFDGNPLGIPDEALDSTGSVSLNGFNLNANGLPEFLITLNGTQGTPSSVVVQLTWTGVYDPSCVKPGTTVTTTTQSSPPAPAPTPPSPSTSAPSAVVTGAPSVTSTGAGFTGAVNPSGLGTTAFFEYALDPKYTGGGPLVYTQSTPAESVGSDFTSHAVSASVSGLVPNALYHVRLVASNSAGTTFGPDVAFTTARAPAPGAPTLGRSFNITPVSGIVLLLLHGQLVPVTQVTQIPQGTVIDALHGTIQVITAAGGGHPAHDAAAKKGKGKKGAGKTQSGTFGGGVFKIKQAHNGLATLSLVEGAFAGAPSFATCKAHKAGEASAAALSSKTLQLLHASAKGKFATKGRFAAATVRGTKWGIADRCDGTRIRDITDSVAVTDFVRHKTIILHAGQSYLAKARK
jgi:hypothetical protein